MDGPGRNGINLMAAVARIRITIRGAVQGVGFRPFVYRLAKDLKLTGWVSNSSHGVTIEADGPKSSLDELLVRVRRDCPTHASIQSLEYSFLDPASFRTFEIRPSEQEGTKSVLILPDIATCADCLSDIFATSNRRHLYPFTNCTNCGPRFTIIESLPYDRANTTMRHFSMCAQCRSEYEDNLDRRFHAQPNACPECGPQVEVWDAAGGTTARRNETVPVAVEALKAGLILAVKGLGGFHLMADAGNDDAVRRLRLRKRREEKPFALMAPSLESVRELCRLNALEERALAAPESPIVILSRKDHSSIAPSVAPNNPYLGIMLPYTPLHHMLIREMKGPLVATSGNRSDEPIAIDEHEAVHRLCGIADAFLVHNRPIRRHADDSIVRILLGREQVLRRARGYAPLPVRIENPARTPVIAVGAHLKNTVALAMGTNVFVSQHIGDLETKEAFLAFQQTIHDFQDLYDNQPRVIAADSHPDYASTAHARDFANSRGISIERVQHHWAHVLSCMAENGVEPPALGVAWDGTGYGPDGTIWGGEFLLIRSNGFKRVAHLRTFPLPGGGVAIKKPAHVAKGLLYEISGSRAFTGSEPPILRQMLEKGIHCPRTSSAGRLFDAVASLMGLRDEVSFEGQAAMELEFRAAADIEDCFDYAIRREEVLVIDWEPMIRQIVEARDSRVPPSLIAARFHNTLARIIVDVAQRIGERRVLLSGGCFQNRYLTERTVQLLAYSGLTAYWHQRVPPNDGGIALGQIVAALQLMEEEKPCVLQSRAR
jgi:hydrogenase maturation protein HypF